jgi:peroxiredoxin
MGGTGRSVHVVSTVKAGWWFAGPLLGAIASAAAERFGLDYGILRQEWRLLQRAVFVIDAADQIAYAEYVADQMRQPNYKAALAVVRQMVSP